MPTPDAREENGYQLTPLPCKTPEERGSVHQMRPPDDTPRPPDSQVKDTAGDTQTEVGLGEKAAAATPDRYEKKNEKKSCACSTRSEEEDVTISRKKR